MSDLFFLFFSMILFGFGLLFAFAGYAFTCIGRMRMFQKAGVNGWKAWVPFYRDYVLCEITMGKGWYFFFGLIPFLFPFTRAVYAYEVMLSYGQSFLFGILYYFFPSIAELVIGFGNAYYTGAQDLEAQIRTIFKGGSGRPPYDGGAGAEQAKESYTQNSYYTDQSADGGNRGTAQDADDRVVFEQKPDDAEH